MTQAPVGSRRALRAGRRPRHAADQREPSFAASLAALGALDAGGAQVSASVVDLRADATLLAVDEDLVMPIAGVGTVLLLVELAARMRDRGGPGDAVVPRAGVESVGGPGLWKHLRAPELSAPDLGVLIGGSGDALAASALARTVGLDAARARAASIGLRRTTLLDPVIEPGMPAAGWDAGLESEPGHQSGHEPGDAVGTTAELAGLFAALAHGEVVDSLTSRLVTGWLALGADLSMVADPFGLDPLAHRGLDHGIQLVNSTGAGEGLRVDAGVVSGPSGAVAYAVAVRFDDHVLAARLRVLRAMRTVGLDVLELVAG